MKDPPPRRSLRDLSSSQSRLLCEVAASGTLSFPEGAGPPWLDPPGLGSAHWWLSSEVPGIRILRLGSPLTCRTARSPSSRVGSNTRTAHRLVLAQGLDPSREHQQLRGVRLAGHRPNQDLQLRVGQI
jgi:hypothetical protein